MLRIVVDMFSGRPNPSWELTGVEAESALDAIAALSDGVTSASEGFHGPWMRGLVVEAKDPEASSRRGLPESFVIGGGGAADDPAALGLVEELLATTDMFDQPFREHILAQVETTQQRVKDASTWADGPDLPSAEVEGEAMVLVDPGEMEIDAPTGSPLEDDQNPLLWDSGVLVGAYNPVFWGNTHQAVNNCYAYGANRRTDTWPRPGLHGNQPLPAQVPYAAPTLPELITGIDADGAVPMSGSPGWLFAAVSTSNEVQWWDFHFLRLVYWRSSTSPVAMWGHKRSTQPVTFRDWANSTITNPQTCDLGPYTEWGGYFKAPSTMQISGILGDWP